MCTCLQKLVALVTTEDAFLLLPSGHATEQVDKSRHRAQRVGRARWNASATERCMYATMRSCSSLGGAFVAILRLRTGNALAVILSLRGGPATEQANKSVRALATAQSIYVSAQEPHSVVKDEHHCCRTLLFASYAILRSDNNGKQGWQP